MSEQTKPDSTVKQQTLDGDILTLDEVNEARKNKKDRTSKITISLSKKNTTGGDTPNRDK